MFGILENHLLTYLLYPVWYYLVFEDWGDMYLGWRFSYKYMKQVLRIQKLNDREGIAISFENT